METLNVSGNPLSINARTEVGPDLGPGLALKSLIMLDTPLIGISDLANLSSRLPKLRSLKYSIDPETPLNVQSGNLRLKGNLLEDRVILIALFSKLEMLNGTDVRPKERDEAERRYLQIMAERSEAGVQSEEWRIYDVLAKKHGQTSRTSAKSVSTVIHPQSLKSKLISEFVPPSGCLAVD